MKVCELTKTREGKRIYWLWAAMVQRCHNSTNEAFVNYGARGISVCPEWRGSFKNFLQDMGPRPAGYVIDRLNNDEGYSPSNCVWADRKTSNTNRRNVILVATDSGMVSLKEACRIRGLAYRPVHKRLERGWAIEKALSQPIGVRHAAAK